MEVVKISDNAYRSLSPKQPFPRSISTFTSQKFYGMEASLSLWMFLGVFLRGKVHK